MKLGQTIGRWLRTDRERSRPGAAGVRALATSAGVDQATPREGELRFVALDEVLAPHAALAERIRIAYGGAEGGFEAQITPLIRRFAAFVHLLPATRDAHFRGAGGCLQCGLEVGLHALQTADGQIFCARDSVPARRAAAPRWRAAAFATGLCSEIHRAVFGAVVSSDDGGHWHPLQMPLHDWLKQGGCDRYFIQWPDASTPQRATTLAVLPQLLGASLLEFLAEPDRTILDHVLAAIAAPSGPGPNALGAIVEQTLSRVVARDLRRAPPSRPALSMAEAGEPVTPESHSQPENPVTGDVPGMEPRSIVSPQESAASESDLVAGVDQALQSANPADAGEPSVLAHDASSERAPRRPLAVPATLNPIVADALRALLSPPSGDALAAGVELSAEGIYVPLGLWEQCGLDTGLAVRSLHDARLLVLQGARKVWRKRRGDAEVPGLMLSARLLA